MKIFSMNVPCSQRVEQTRKTLPLKIKRLFKVICREKLKWQTLSNLSEIWSPPNILFI